MTLGLLGAFVGLLFGSGLLLVAGAFRAERPTLSGRVLPYVPEVAWYLQHDTESTPRVRGRSAMRPRRSTRGSTAPDLNGERLLWGAAALTLAAAVWFLLGGDVLTQSGDLAAVSMGGLAIGLVSHHVVFVITERRGIERTGRELPLVAEMLSTSVSAGLGLEEALRRCAGDRIGGLAGDLSAVARAAEDGVPLPRSLEAMAEATAQPQVAEFLFGLAVALDRGTPLADVLRSQSLDVRTARVRGLARSERRRAWLVLAVALFVGGTAMAVVLLWSGSLEWPPAPDWLRR